jgi:hypothetical protein
MPDEPAYIRNLKTFTRGDLKSSDLPKLSQYLYSGNDRATALVLSSVTEVALEGLIKSRMRPKLNSETRRVLFDPEGPLGSFSAKTALAYALGLIGPLVQSDLYLIRMIRNKFAHSRKPFDFDTQEVKDVCAHLQTPDLPGVHVPYDYLNTVPEQMRASARDKTHGRTRYVMACFAVSERMLLDKDQLPTPLLDQGHCA